MKLSEAAMVLIHNVQKNYLGERYVINQYYAIFFEALVQCTVLEPYIRWHWCQCHFRCSHGHYVPFMIELGLGCEIRQPIAVRGYGPAFFRGLQLSLVSRAKTLCPEQSV